MVKLAFNYTIQCQKKYVMQMFVNRCDLMYNDELNRWSLLEKLEISN